KGLHWTRKAPHHNRSQTRSHQQDRERVKLRLARLAFQKRRQIAGGSEHDNDVPTTIGGVDRKVESARFACFGLRSDRHTFRQRRVIRRKLDSGVQWWQRNVFDLNVADRYVLVSTRSLIFIQAVPDVSLIVNRSC